MNKEELISTGAEVSPIDDRTVQHSDMAMITTPLVKGGVVYDEDEIEHQHIVGICTAISRTQLRQKQTGRKYSADFQYLLQKKYFDVAWFEGSSVFAACKIAKNYGFLPIELFTDKEGTPYVTEDDRYLPYDQYIKKLRQIPEEEVQRLIGLCTDKIAGYAAVNVSDPQAIAKAIEDSPGKAGILCRYDCGLTWWTKKSGASSWKEKDISPLRKPNPATSGHAIIMAHYDYSDDGVVLQTLANTWGKTWARKGSCDIDWSNYSMTEAYVDLATAPIIPPYVFTKTLKLGSALKEDVKQLQKKLNSLGFSCGTVDGVFGVRTKTAVVNFQIRNGLIADGVVGPKTNEKLNK